MTRYLMYKKKINNLGEQRLPKIALNSSKKQRRLKQGWHKGAMSWLKMWGIDENVTLQKINDIEIFYHFGIQREGGVIKI